MSIFGQGYGWCTMEETSWGDSEHLWVKPGQLFTKGPGTYKIPAFNDVPSDMRVKLMDRANAFAVHSSKVMKWSQLLAIAAYRFSGERSGAVVVDGALFLLFSPVV